MLDPLQAPSANLPKGFKLFGLSAAGVAVAAVALGIGLRQSDLHAQGVWSRERAIPTVQTLQPTASPTTQSLVLPGSLQAFIAAPIYARVSGYLRAWNTDIGAPVRAGDVLATIDTPELDQQIEQARADLSNAQAEQGLAQTTARRWADLVKSEAVSKQEADEKNADLLSKSEQVKARRAALDRLTALKAFARLTAPFDGIVTSRSADIGQLINSGASPSAAPLFTVSDIRQIRIYVQAPQVYEAALHPGLTAELSLPDYPGRRFQARVTDVSGAINDQSGTMLIQLQAANPDGALKPGAYAEVTFNVAATGLALRLPASTLIFRQNGLQVAVVGPDNRVSLKPVVIAHDLGAEVEIAGGVAAGDHIVNNPSDSLTTGDVVRVASAGGGHG